jgi:hypothetical protein
MKQVMSDNHAEQPRGARVNPKAMGNRPFQGPELREFSLACRRFSAATRL